MWEIDKDLESTLEVDRKEKEVERDADRKKLSDSEDSVWALLGK